MKEKSAITLSEEILEQLKEYAKKEDRTVSSQINKILKDYLKSEHLLSFVLFRNIHFLSTL